MKRITRRCVLMLLGAVAIACTADHPTDALLEATFQQQRPTFERLLELERSHVHLQRVAHDWCETVDGVRYFGPTQGVLVVEDWGEYRQLFYALDLGDGVESRDGVVYFLASTKRHGADRSVRGYAYSAGAPRACDPAVGPWPDRPGTCFRPLSDGWYLFQRNGAS